ncbi:MAG: DUF882 domain-containing protein [Myxococcales bacterium]|nr:DUF882 domain-containing protein [Polyangiaceae bacterium]MDW8248345.1 DUF882 domain-containing protein [Myxococcales bacterium]
MQRFLILATPVALLLAPHLTAAAPRSHDAEDREVTHQVAPGQTLAKIAKRYRVSIEAIREHNNLPPGPLKPGMRLTIPLRHVPLQAIDAPEGGRTKNHPGKAGRSEDDRDDEEQDEANLSKKRKGKKLQESQEHKEADPPSSRVEVGHVRLIHGDATWEGKVLLTRKGKIAPAAAKAFARLLAPPKGRPHPIHHRLIALIAKVSDHFGGRPIEVVSGFHPGKGGSPSQHSAGAALDFHIPGVRNEELRDYLRTFDQVGVGYYPNGGFVHLDVRSTSFSWTDTSRTREVAKQGHEEPTETDKKSGRSGEHKNARSIRDQP